MVSSYLMKEHRALDELTAQRKASGAKKTALMASASKPEPERGRDDKAGEAAPARERRDQD
jgi:hypothetical protein